jgi:hypothetical protein
LNQKALNSYKIIYSPRFSAGLSSQPIIKGRLRIREITVALRLTRQPFRAAAAAITSAATDSNACEGERISAHFVSANAILFLRSP